MAIDYNRNEYVKIGNHKNIVAEFPKDRQPPRKLDASIELCWFMEPLISKVALTHPEWLLVGVDAHWMSSRETYVIKRFKIYCGTEYIGRIYRDGYEETLFKFDIHNGRIEKTRKKYGGTRTKDLKKALKVIETSFAPLDMKERREEAVAEMSNHIRSKTWSANRQLNTNLESMTDAIATYLVRNMDSVRSELESLGAPAIRLSELPQLLETCRGLWQVETSRDLKRGTTVVLMDGRYMLIPDNDPFNETVVTASQLSSEMSAKIGILKVFDKDDEAIENVGMRLDASTFYLIG